MIFILPSLNYSWADVCISLKSRWQCINCQKSSSLRKRREKFGGLLNLPFCICQIHFADHDFCCCSKICIFGKIHMNFKVLILSVPRLYSIQFIDTWGTCVRNLSRWYFATITLLISKRRILWKQCWFYLKFTNPWSLKWESIYKIVRCKTQPSLSHFVRPRSWVVPDHDVNFPRWNIPHATDYNRFKELIKSIKVVNDCAERSENDME